MLHIAGRHRNRRRRRLKGAGQGNQRIGLAKNLDPRRIADTDLPDMPTRISQQCDRSFTTFTDLPGHRRSTHGNGHHRGFHAHGPRIALGNLTGHQAEAAGQDFQRGMTFFAGRVIQHLIHHHPARRTQ